MTDDRGEAFLDRWSRLKQRQAEAAPPAEAEASGKAPARAEATAPAEPAPALPPVEDLKPDSDFTPFMQPKVDPATRRAALKKLFTDAHFNLPDPYEAYSEDYTKGEPIPAEMLRAINRVRDLAVKGPEKVAEEERLAAEEAAAAPAAPHAQSPSPAESKTEAAPEGTDDVAGTKDA